MDAEQHHLDIRQGAYWVPELLDEELLSEGRTVPMVPVDVYSLGVLIYEVLSRVLYFPVVQAQHSGRCFLGNCPFIL